MRQSVRLEIIENMQTTIRRFDLAMKNTKYREKLKSDMHLRDITDEKLAVAYKQVVPSARRVIRDITESKVIVFPAGQAGVFLDAIGKIDFQLEHSLPFQKTLLQFSEPIVVSLADPYNPGGIKGTEIGALLLSQETTQGVTRNLGFLIEKNLFQFRPFFWDSATSDPLPSHKDEGSYGVTDRLAMIDIRNLAIACIGYINCENVYLQREGEVPEAVNAKRERKGKSRLEPYYVCRIRGVQYDSAGNPTGEGAKHSIRYDVRGHFRRLTTGKTTWVRPHQRGLENELYIPKTYLVDRKEPA